MKSENYKTVVLELEKSCLLVHLQPGISDYLFD